MVIKGQKWSRTLLSISKSLVAKSSPTLATPWKVHLSLEFPNGLPFTAYVLLWLECKINVPYLASWEIKQANSNCLLQLQPSSWTPLGVQSLSHVWLFVTPWTVACQASCPSPTPGAYSNSCPSCWWCHPTISSSVVPFSSRLQSFPASGSFQMSQFFTSGGQSIQHQSFQWIFRTDFL